jgi:alkylhydroperoxidase family enzyme
MRLSKPRVEPLDPEQASPEVRQLLDQARVGDSTANIFATLAHHPDLMRRWLRFGNHILFKNSLPAREREMLILRIGWLCRAGYEWGQHVAIARRDGMSDEEIAAIAKGPDDPHWSADDQALLRAVDELHADAFVSDATWQALEKILSRQQLLDLVFTVGQYNMVSMALNTLGVQLDRGVPTFEDAPGFRPDGL